MERISKINRKTKETDIKLQLNLDGEGKSDISTTIPFLDHVLESFARHGRFDLTIKSSGDTAVESHHLVEDLGICLGQAIAECLKDKKGIVRFADVTIPMDEAEISGLKLRHGAECRRWPDRHQALYGLGQLYQQNERLLPGLSLQPQAMHW